MFLELTLAIKVLIKEQHRLYLKLYKTNVTLIRSGGPTLNASLTYSNIKQKALETIK